MKIETPFLKIIEFSDKEFKNVFINLDRVSYDNTDLYYHLKTNFKHSPFLLIVKYTPSLSFSELGNKTNFLFSEENFISRNICIELGRILGFNIFINNKNRNSQCQIDNNLFFNLRSLNFLNFDDILFEVDLDKLIPNTNFKKNSKAESNNMDLNLNINNINQMLTGKIFLINSITETLDSNNKERLHKVSEYLNQLEALFDSLFSRLKSILLKKGLSTNTKIDEAEENQKFYFSDIPFINEMNDSIKSKFNFTLSNKNIFHILIGLSVMIQDISEVDLKVIEKISDFVLNKSIRKDTEENTFAINCRKICIDYFKYMINFFKQTKEKFTEIFEWNENVSMGLYSIKFSSGLEELFKRQEGFLTDLQIQNNANINKNDNNIINNNSSNAVKNNNQNNNNANSLKNSAAIENSNTKNFNNNSIINENDNLIKRNFLIDVHNGVYDYYDLTNDMIMERIKVNNNENNSANLSISNSLLKVILFFKIL